MYIAGCSQIDLRASTFHHNRADVGPHFLSSNMNFIEHGTRLGRRRKSTVRCVIIELCKELNKTKERPVILPCNADSKRFRKEKS